MSNDILTIWCSLTGTWPNDPSRNTEDCPSESSQAQDGNRELGEKYVRILKDMVERNLYAPEEYPTRRYPFKCLTDHSIEGIDCVVDESMPKSWWNKVWLYKYATTGRNLYIDLDTVITGRLEELIEKLKGHPFVVMKDLAPRRMITTALLYWEGDHSDIYKDFETAGFPTTFGQTKDIFKDETRKYVGGDAAWFAHTRPNAPFIQHIWPGRIKSYKLNMLMLDWPTDDVAIVCMHGLPRTHQITTGWVPKIWCMGGIHQVVWKAFINTEHSKMLANVEENVKDPNAKLLVNIPPEHNGTMCICAGGPSLGDKQNLDYLRTWRDSGATIWAMNGSYDFLQQQGIVPDGMVLMDARTQNIKFLDNPHGKTTFYLATICNPVIFKRLAKYNVLAWHPDIEGIGDQQILVGGGTTVGLRALCLAWVMGYRRFQMFGYDSSYRVVDDKKEGHAFDQPMNTGELEIEIEFAGRTFKCARWMAVQCEQLRSVVETLVVEKKCEITVIGDGLFPYVINLDSNGPKENV